MYPVMKSLLLHVWGFFLVLDDSTRRILQKQGCFLFNVNFTHGKPDHVPLKSIGFLSLTVMSKPSDYMLFSLPSLGS